MYQCLDLLHQRFADETVEIFIVEKRRRLLGLLLFGLRNGHNNENDCYKKTQPHAGRVWKINGVNSVGQMQILDQVALRCTTHCTTHLGVEIVLCKGVMSALGHYKLSHC